MTTLNGVIDAVTDNATSSNDLAIAAGQIIAKRFAMGVAAAFDPMRADPVEFGRMVPEKMEAFSAAGMIILEQSSHAGWEITRLALASDEVITAAQATLSLTAVTNPMAMAEAQGQFALAWVNRVTSNFFAMGLLALGAQKAAMAPIQQTIAANAERLSL